MVIASDQDIRLRQLLLSASDNYIKVILVIFLCFAPLHYILGSKDFLIFLRIAQFAGLILFILSCHELFELSKTKMVEYRTSTFSLLFLILIMSVILCKIANRNFHVYDLIYPLVYFGCCINLVKNKHPTNIFKILFYLISIFLIYKAIFVSNPNYWIRGSANQVSALMLPSCILLYIDNYRTGKTIGFMPAILTFIISVMCHGTGGIISAFILLLGVSYTRFINSNFIIKSSYFFVLIILCTILVYLFSVVFPFFREFMQTFVSLNSGTEPRLGVILYYFETMSTFEYMFGNPNALNLYFKMYNLTSHNSFLSIHSILGIGIILAFVIILKAILHFLYNKHYFLVFLLLVLFLRASTDDLLYSGHLFFTIPSFYIVALCGNSIVPSTKYIFLPLKNLNCIEG